MENYCISIITVITTTTPEPINWRLTRIFHAIYHISQIDKKIRLGNAQHSTQFIARARVRVYSCMACIVGMLLFHRLGNYFDFHTNGHGHYSLWKCYFF